MGLKDVFERADLEDKVWEAARDLGLLEQNFAEEIVRLVAAGTPSYQAQRMAEVRFIQDIALERANYEIALARLRRT